MRFKDAHPLERRAAEAARIKERYPGRIPVIVEPAARAADVPPIDKSKFLVPGNMTVGQFLYTLRKRLALPAEKALFLFVGSTLPTTATLISQLYEEHADGDGFLYLSYSGESTFGAGECAALAEGGAGAKRR